MAEAKRRLAAILAADVAGYSRLMCDDERATMDQLDVCRGVFRKRIAEHDGCVVDTAGDSVLATFPSVVEAVACAAVVQDDLAGHNAALPEDRRMQFRIGVNLGDVFEQADGTVYGDGVNVAARLESLAAPGGICLSGSAYEQVDGKTDLAFEDLGEHEVKNIARPVRAWRVGAGEQKAPAEPLALPDKPSIAVLPFDNLSGDPEQDFFADGIAEDLITALSRIRWLFVIARNSTFAYKGTSPDIRQVGRELGVRYVLEGSVRKGGNRIRVSAQLIDAASGAHVWAQRYDRELADLFDLQDDITETIAAAIEPEIGEVERDRARRKPPESLDAWEYYQRGMWSFYQNTKETNAQARQLFERAVECDRGFGPAHGGLAFTHLADVAFGFGEQRDRSLDEALRAAETAVAIDDKDGHAHAVLGRVYAWIGKDSAAIEELRIAIRIQPSSVFAHYSMGFPLISTGHPREAFECLNTAARLSPHDPFGWLFDTLRAFARNVSGDHEAAIDWAERACRRPGIISFWPLAHMASSLGHMGRRDEAQRAIDRARESEPRFSYAFLKNATPFEHLEHLESYFDGLRKAGLDIPE
jgi:adenylate cyclase